jgi:hypothetical protein
MDAQSGGRSGSQLSSKGIACECHVFSIDYYVFLREGLVSSLLELLRHEPAGRAYPSEPRSP